MSCAQCDPITDQVVTYCFCEMITFHFQIQCSDVVLYIIVKHGFPELKVSPYQMFLYTAVGKLCDARTQFLQSLKYVIKTLCN